MERDQTDGVERILTWPRIAVGCAVGFVAFVVPSVSPPGVVLIGAWLVLTSLLARRAARANPSPYHGIDISTAALISDTVACGALFALLGLTPHSPAALGVPLLAFELALKRGVAGAVLAGVIVVAAIVTRASLRFARYGLTPRYDAAMLVIAVAGAFLGAGMSLRTRDQERQGAIAEKERIAASLRATVMELLTKSGRDADAWENAQLAALLDAACHTPDVAPDLAAHLARQLSDETDPFEPSPREQEVLTLLSQGLNDRQIAAELFLSPGTVRVHISNASKKLGASNRTEAVEAFRRRR